MSSIFNRLFQKTDTTEVSSLDYSKPRSEFLQHFYDQGFKSDKLDYLIAKIKKISFDTHPYYKLIQGYLQIEHYLTAQDAGFLGNKDSLRLELDGVFSEIANSRVFEVLHFEDTTQEIYLGLLQADYLYQAALDHIGYLPILSPEFVLDKTMSLDDIDGNMVYYLSCRRKIREYISKLHTEIRKSCEEKKLENDFSLWNQQFESYFEKLPVSRKMEYYLPDDMEQMPQKTDIAANIENKPHKETKKAHPEKEEDLFVVTENSPIDKSLSEAIFENMLDRALVFTRSGKIIRANESARDLFNFQKKDLGNNNIFDLLPAGISKELRADVEDTTHKRNRIVLGKREEIHLTKQDGTINYYEITTSNNYTEGDDTYSMFFKNITKKRDTLDSLSKEMEHVQRAAKAKSTFLSNMSHEIRTPLNVILGLADIIKRSDNRNTELFEKNIDGIDFSAKSLLSIVNDILDFSKIEAGKLSIQSYNYNLRKVITSLADGFKTKANENGVNLYTEIDKDIPDIVVGDQYRLNQILTNLVGNAIKFTTKGEIGIIVKHKELSEEQIEVQFEVKDTGIGIPADRLDRIFDSFYQIEEAGHSKSNGTGLGLAITKELISLQNGELTATSVAGKGSSFRFKIPLTKSKLQSTEETIDTQKRNDKELEGMRILVAEDNTMNQFYIKQLLNRLGIEVDIAENGMDAFDIYSEKDKGYYDLILMDMHMPILGGIEAIKKIRQSHKDSIKKVPIVICSADVFPESRKNAIKAGIDFYLTKPVDEDALKEVLFWLISDDETDLNQLNISHKEDTHSSAVNMAKLKETFDNDEEFILSLLQVFIEDIPDDYKSLSSCIEREFYPRASELAHKMKSSFMNLGMTHQGHFLQQIETNINTREGVETGIKHFEEFKKMYTKTLLDVNIQLIELKRS